MATPLSAAAVVSALRSEGASIREYDGWRTHNRNQQGAWGPVHGVMIHHTVTSGTAASVDLCRRGYSGLPGPLCHAVGDKSGTLHLIGHGRANHAGSGSRAVLDAVIAEKATLPPPGSGTDGNARFYGIELINLGDGKDPWPEEQADAAARWAAALCRAHGWSERSVIGHLEWQAGKVDPRPAPGSADMSMSAFRARVRALLARGPGEGPDTPEDDMPERTLYGTTDGYRLEVPPNTRRQLTFDRVHESPGGWREKAAEPSIVFGPCFYSTTLAIRATGLTRGQEIQIQLAHYRRTADDAGWERSGGMPISSPVHDGGDLHAIHAWQSHITGARRGRVRAEIQHFGDAPITITYARAESLYWPGGLT